MKSPSVPCGSRRMREAPTGNCGGEAILAGQGGGDGGARPRETCIPGAGGRASISRCRVMQSMRFFKHGKRDLDSTSQRKAGFKRGFADEALPHMDAVYRFALRLCQGRRSEADDVLQETFMRAYQSWRAYESGTECRSWLFTICRNEFLKKVGREKKKPEVLTSEIDADGREPGTALGYWVFGQSERLETGEHRWQRSRWYCWRTWKPTAISDASPTRSRW
ncbi:MAG: RNA polymerase sigma factor [Longimicrobiaceae bacterium]